MLLSRIAKFTQMISLLFFIGNFINSRKETSSESTVKLSDIRGPFSHENYKEMRSESEKIVDFIYKNIFNTNANEGNNTYSNSGDNDNILKFLIDEPKFKNHNDSLICKACLWSFTKFHNLLEKKYGLTLFNEFLTVFCSIGIKYEICHEAVDLYSGIVVDALIEHYLDAEYICTKTHLCKFSHYNELNPDDYARELLKDKPLKVEVKVDDSAQTWKVLHVTDFHTDLLYEEGSIGLCAEPLCCRKENGRSKDKSSDDYAGRWGFQGKCDIPLRTLDLFIETVVNDIQPDFIIWTGDNPPHNPWNENSEEIYNVTKIFIDLLLNKYGYKGQVFAALGNHEEYITDQYNPNEINARESKFLRSFADLLQPWLSHDEHRQFLRHGFYSSKFKDSNLRIISLNCFLCDIMNFFLIENPTDPDRQFQWLESTLRQAERDKEFVLLIGHIPPGDSTYLSQCSKRYNALVDRFSHIIRGQFYGHTHYDEFRLITEYFNTTNIAGVIHTSPSLTTYSWGSPSFRVYDLDSNTKLVKDYHQYRLNITQANLNPEVKPKFIVAYSGQQAFGFQHLNDYQPFKTSVSKILNDNDWFNFIVDSFFTQGDDIASYTTNKKLGNYLTCRFGESVFDEYLKCTGYRTWDYVEYLNRFIEVFSGNWYVKIYHEDVFKNNAQHKHKALR